MAVLSKARLQPLLTKMLNFSSYTYFPFKSLLRENIKRLIIMICKLEYLTV